MKDYRQQLSTLNSNLILLIQKQNCKGICALLCFKFQSDSINTVGDLLEWLSQKALNSNLILLIQQLDKCSIRAYYCFKFQSDSINTRVQRHL